MEKKRYKMYKKGKDWVIAPLIFMSLLGTSALILNNTSAYADEAPSDGVVSTQLSNGSETAETSIVSQLSDETKSTVPGLSSDKASVTNSLNSSETMSMLAEEKNTSDSSSTDISSRPSEIAEENTTDKKAEGIILPNTEENSDTSSSDSDSTDNSNKTPETEIKDSDGGITTSNISNEDTDAQETALEGVANQDSASQHSSQMDSDNNNQQTTFESDADHLQETHQHDKFENSIQRETESSLSESSSDIDKTPVENSTEEKNIQTRSNNAENQAVAIYRVYNPNSGEHLHTMNSNERDYLKVKGWYYEGISMYVTNEGNDLYRLYNPNSGEHFYTLDMNEVNMLKKAGWNFEGLAWKTPITGIPVYRVYNPNTNGAGAHHYTMNAGERDSLVSAGWKSEGISWYSEKEGSPINLDFMGIARQDIVDQLTSHLNDNYYLGTPYKGLASNNALDYMQPQKGMNCTGFVSHVIQYSGGDMNKISSISNQWGGLANAYNWKNALVKQATNHIFNSVSELLNSGVAKKGDIIYFDPDYSVADYDCHIGFFWGDVPSENKIWHSVPDVNKISNIYAPSGFSKIHLFSM